MAKITGPVFCSWAVGSLGKSITFKRRHGYFYLSKKKVHTGRMRPWEREFAIACRRVAAVEKLQILGPVFILDNAFGFASPEDWA